MSELLKKQNYGVEVELQVFQERWLLMQLQKSSELQLPDQITLATRQEQFRITGKKIGR